MERFNKKFFYVFLGLIFILGFFFRVKAFVFSRSLWCDELFLFVNCVVKNGFFDMFGKLICMQSAPPLFLYIEKVFINLFGVNENVIRLFPFICSLFSIQLFYIFSKIYLRKSWSLVAANLLFAINLPLIYYAQELKQYASDVLVFMLLFVLLNNLTIEKFTPKRVVLFILLTLIAPLLSMPSYFVLATWFFRELITYGYKQIKNLILVYIPCGIMSLVYLVTTMIPQHNDLSTHFYNLWGPGFISLNIVQDIKLLGHNLLYFFVPNTQEFLLGGFVIAGLIIFCKNYRQKEVSLFMLTIAIMLIFSLLKIYPLFERTCLYSIPLVIVLLTKPLDYISGKRKFLSLLLVFVFLASLSNYNLSYFKECYNEQLWNFRFVNSYPKSKDLMKSLKDNYHNETIIVNYSSQIEYRYYCTFYGFEAKNVIYIPSVKKSVDEYVKYLDSITKRGERYVFFFAGDYTPDEIELKSLKIWKNKYKVLSEKDLNPSYLLYVQKS